MKRILPSSAFLFLITASLCGSAELVASTKPETFLKQQNSKSGFIENKGQIIDQNNKPNPAVLYLLNTPGMNVQLRSSGWSYDVYKVSSQQSAVSSPQSRFPESSIQHPASSIIFHRVDLDLQDYNPDYNIKTSKQSSDYLNYYTTGTPAEGVTSVRSYSTITYKNIYPGIDLQFINDDRQFEYNFILQPGADINSIKLKVYGPEKIKKFREGLRCKTSLGDVDETIPVCYYTINDIKIPVKGRFKKIAEHLYGFAVDQEIPAGAFLVIDPIPTRRWGTYYGSATTWYGGCTTDPIDNVYMTGETADLIHIATAGAFQPLLAGGTDAFLVKFNTDGQRIWGTYYGNSGYDAGYSCSADRLGDVYIVGSTSSTTGMATPGAPQMMLRGELDGFVAKFDTSGQRIWSTYYGGNEVPPGGDNFEYCATDTLGNVYCAGITTSPDFIATPGACQFTFGGYRDNDLVKFYADGQLAWGTYYGGVAQEQNPGCSVSKNGYVYITGNTNSPNNIATPGSFLPVYPGIFNGYLACFTLDGVRLWGTYFGGTSGGTVNCSAADNSGNFVYICGLASSSTNIATPGTYEPASPNGGGYINKFSFSGNRIWGTYYGYAFLEGAAVDDSGYIFAVGREMYTDSLVPSPGAYQTRNRGQDDIVLTKFSSSGQRIWGTYYGGANGEGQESCTVDHNDNIYISGNSTSENQTSHKGFCTRNPYDNIIASPDGLYTEFIYPYDAFLVKFADCWSPDTALQINGPSSLCQNTIGIVFSIAPIPTATDYTWCVTGDITITAGQHTTSITVNVGSTLGLDTISVYGINACDTGFPKVITRRVYQRPVPVVSGSDTTCAGIDNLYTTKGGKSNYQWTVSPGGTITLNGTVTDSSCTVIWSTAGAHWVKVGYTDTTGCVAMNPTQFNLWVNPGLIASISISPSANPVCAGISITFMAIPVNEGVSPAYQWMVNGNNVGTSNPSYTYNPVNGDIVTCQLTSSLTGCLSGNPATSNQVVMTVDPILSVSVTVTASQNPVCSGTTVTFTANPINGGTTPSYQWKVNGTVAGTNSPTYSYIPVNGDLVTCILTSSEQCTSSNPASSIQYLMTVNPNLPVSVSITSSSNPFCAGSSVTFTATPTNGGTTPSYQWKVNSTNAGTNSPNFTYNPSNGDQVYCILTSSEQCTSSNPASSIIITMVENSSLPAGVSIAASSNPFCPGSSVTFMAIPINGGSTPSFQWKVNGVNAGTNSSTFTYNPANNDSVRCIMTSNLACVTGNPASSAKIIMSGTLAPIVSFTSCFDTITTFNAKPIKLKGGIPLGGTYSGPGVNSLTGVYTPALAGVGTHTITYTYTNAALCSALAHTHIINYPLSIVNCGSPITDVRDNKVYQTIQIGTQCWLASNLNYGTILTSSQDQRNNCISEKYCYNDSPINCTNQGGLYQWDELMLFDETPADQGFCPPGWHIPTENEWNTLFANYINSGFAGSPLKYSGYSGFNAILSGARHINKGWNFQGFATFFWSSTSFGTDKAWAHGMNDPDPSVSAYPSSRVNAFSVRCLKD
jgi:uncharacterized protein (TIGR02145 family)